MIPFFRKIRKKMADDNKSMKYIRYAIGETVLIVIGILIALQLNNWNKNRISKNETKDLLKALIIENDSNIQELENAMKEIVINMSNNVELLGHMGVNYPDKNKYLIDSLIERSYYFPTLSLSINSVVINNIISRSKVNLIQQDSLQFYLSNWGNRLDEIIRRENMTQKRMDDYLTPYLYDKYSFVNAAIVYNHDIDKPFELKNSTFKVNLELLNDLRFENIISEILWSLNILNSEYEITLVYLIKMDELIKRELN